MNIFTKIKKPSINVKLPAYFLTSIMLTLLVLALPGNIIAQSESTVWYDDLEAAKVIAAKENKVIMLHFWATWCTPCKNLDKFVFSNPDVNRALSENVIAVKVNVDHRSDLAKKYQVTNIPAEVVISADGVPISKRSSPNTADAYVKMVRGFTGLLGADQKALAKISQQQAEMAAERESSAPFASKMAGGGVFSPTASNENTLEPNLFGNSIVADAQQRLAQKLTQQTNEATENINKGYANMAERINDELARSQTNLNSSIDTAGQGISDTIQKTAEQADPYIKETEKTLAQINQVMADQNLMEQIAIEGYCPVTLINQETWNKGDSRWGCVHRGKTYLFTSKENRDLFRMAPDAYSPLLAGFDPVFFEEHGELLEGKRKHGAFFGGDVGPKIVVLFRDNQSREKFESDPARYIQTVRQAMNQTDRDTIYR